MEIQCTYINPALCVLVRAFHLYFRKQHWSLRIVCSMFYVYLFVYVIFASSHQFLQLFAYTASALAGMLLTLAVKAKERSATVLHSQLHLFIGFIGLALYWTHLATIANICLLLTSDHLAAFNILNVQKCRGPDPSSSPCQPKIKQNLPNPPQWTMIPK